MTLRRFYQKGEMSYALLAQAQRLANNRAAAHARGRWLLLLNPDAYPEPGFIAALKAAAAKSAP